jgi:hypothetical protein
MEVYSSPTQVTSGKILHYNPIEGSLSVVLPQVFFANGITLGQNEEYLLLVVDDDDDVSTSSTESSESYSSDESDGITSSNQPSNQTLPLPSLSDVHRGTTRPTPGSVFAIPYKEAENAHMKILEHHVPLDHSEEKVKEGRYARKRKGRQREGDY